MKAGHKLLCVSLLETGEASQKTTVLWPRQGSGGGNQFYSSFSNLFIFQIIHDKQAWFP